VKLLILRKQWSCRINGLNVSLQVDSWQRYPQEISELTFVDHMLSTQTSSPRGLFLFFEIEPAPAVTRPASFPPGTCSWRRSFSASLTSSPGNMARSRSVVRVATSLIFVALATTFAAPRKWIYVILCLRCRRIGLGLHHLVTNTEVCACFSLLTNVIVFKL